MDLVGIELSLTAPSSEAIVGLSQGLPRAWPGRQSRGQCVTGDLSRSYWP